MKLIITIPGMGKTTWRKDERCDRNKYVDFDYHLLKELWTPDVLNANSNVVNTLFKAGVEYVVVNVGLLNLDAVNNDHELIIMRPSDLDALKIRVNERDGSDWLNQFIDECFEQLDDITSKFGKRFKITEVEVDSVTDYFTELGKSEEVTPENETIVEPEQPKDGPEETTDDVVVDENDIHDEEVKHE